MFIVDDILVAPFKAILWLVREVANAAQQEQAAESDRIKDRLREMYMLLETGQMTEQDFDAEEAQLLDRLDVLEGRGEEAAAADPIDAAAADDEADDDEEDDEEDDDEEDDDEEDDDEEDEVKDDKHEE